MSGLEDRVLITIEHNCVDTGSTNVRLEIFQIYSVDSTGIYVGQWSLGRLIIQFG